MSSHLSEGEMVDGKKEGDWITYYANGNKRSEGNYIAGKKQGLWIQYYKNENKANEAVFKNGKHEGLVVRWYENGNLEAKINYGKHRGNSYDGKKQGEAYYYETDGLMVWRIITYKGGSRTKPDEFPLGVCPTCGEGRRLSWKDSCPKCDGQL